MLNKLERFLRQQKLVSAGDRVVCAVSGGADSVALLFAMYLLGPKLGITVEAAHFNHHLRGGESDRDAQFVKQLCDRLEIPLHAGGGQVRAGKKGLEAAARDARYGFLRSIPGKIATAHTADDNAETVLMHLVRGTGLKGLGGIAPVNGALIRPMLEITRQEVLDFLQEYNLQYVEDSTNSTEQFLRNRLRHQVIPLLKRENPRFARNVSAMALRLREDEQALADRVSEELPDVPALRQMPGALRKRQLAAFLESCGVPEPEAEHIRLAEGLVFSDKPSASAAFPGDVTVCRNYDRLEKRRGGGELACVQLPCPGDLELPELGLRIVCCPAESLSNSPERFCVIPVGKMILRSRQSGDRIELPGGHKSLKKLFIDKKIPASCRQTVPVIADEKGILGVFGIGADVSRAADALPAVEIRFEKL